jgi:hypothetical protein
VSFFEDNTLQGVVFRGDDVLHLHPLQSLEAQLESDEYHHVKLAARGSLHVAFRLTDVLASSTLQCGATGTTSPNETAAAVAQTMRKLLSVTRWTSCFPNGTCCAPPECEVRPF